MRLPPPVSLSTLGAEPQMNRHLLQVDRCAPLPPPWEPPPPWEASAAVAATAVETGRCESRRHARSHAQNHARRHARSHVRSVRHRNPGRSEHHRDSPNHHWKNHSHRRKMDSPVGNTDEIPDESRRYKPGNTGCNMDCCSPRKTVAPDSPTRMPHNLAEKRHSLAWNLHNLGPNSQDRRGQPAMPVAMSPGPRAQRCSPCFPPPAAPAQAPRLRGGC